MDQKPDQINTSLPNPLLPQQPPATAHEIQTPQPPLPPQPTPPPQPVSTQPSTVQSVAKPPAGNKRSVIPVLIVIFLLITILFLSYYILTNPARQLVKANNAIRRSGVAKIAQMLILYKSQNGDFPAKLSSTPQHISKTGADICSDLVPDYLPTLPVDPSLGRGNEVSGAGCNDTYDTMYAVSRNADGTVTISAPNAEPDEKISITQ